MKLLIVRHGDPDYDIDSLTEKGWKEVKYLSQRLSKLEVKAFYVSPLGRAKDTASVTLKRTADPFPMKFWKSCPPCFCFRKRKRRKCTTLPQDRGIR